MHWPTSPLEYISRNDLCLQAYLVTTSDFARLCRDRDTPISENQLKRLDQGGFLSPLGRFQRHKFRARTENANGNQGQGVLMPEEACSSELREISAPFCPQFIKSYFEAEQLFEPGATSVDAWDVSKFYNLYSKFQCYSLWKCLNQWRIHVPTVDEIAEKTDDEIANDFRAVSKTVRSLIPDLKIVCKKANEAALLCQAISNRYYPQAQSDRRTIKIVGAIKGEWDWHEYCQNWNATHLAQQLGLDKNEILQMQSRIASEALAVDPLCDWDDLVPFVAVEQRERLRGKALLAELFRSMATMLSLFYEDLSGERPSSQRAASRSILLPEEETDGALRELEYVANKYHLNPRPRLILVVEGESEVDQVKRLIEMFWDFTPSTAGIEIHNLKGISNAVGDKRDSSAPLRRFIDDHHSRQTMVYVLLDWEHGADYLKRELVEHPSFYFHGRQLTADQLIHVWNLNYEFDNFSDAEIARAMSLLTENKIIFLAEEVQNARGNFKAGNGLGKLFEIKAGIRLRKRDLGNRLTDILNEESENAGRIPQRPIIERLGMIIELAARNHQPTSGEAWEENQKSGYLGKQRP